MTQKYWTENKIILELKDIIINIGHFPTQSELKTMNFSGLNTAIFKHGGSNKFREILGEEIIKVNNGYWNDDTIIDSLENVKNQVGHFPSHKELILLNKNDLCRAIQRNGGIYKFQILLKDTPRKYPNGYWTEEVVIQKLKKIIEDLGHFPTSKEFGILKQTTLRDKIKKFGGTNKFRTLFKSEILHKQNNYWNDNTIIENLNVIKNHIGRFPSNVDLKEMNRNDLSGAINLHGGYNKFRKILGDELDIKPSNYWNDETITSELKLIISKINHFPSRNELAIMKEHGLTSAIVKHGGIDKFRQLLGYPISLESSSKMCQYVTFRGYKSEKEVKKILIQYCKQNNLPEPKYNVKLTKGSILEFVCNTGKTIGIDVTNTKSVNGESVRRKYLKKDYHKYLDKLWIVVLSDVFNPEDYLKFNEESPDNVEIMSVWDLIDTLQIDIDEYSRRKLEALEICTIRTKNDLINKLKTILKDKNE